MNDKQNIADYLRAKGFARVYADAGGKPPRQKQDRLRVTVAVMADDLREDMQTRQSIVKLSGDSMAKQADKHRNVTAADYLRVQAIVDGDLIFRINAFKRIGFMRDANGNVWAAVWKKTRDDSEVFLVSFSRRQEQNIRHAPKKYGAPLQRRK